MRSRVPFIALWLWLVVLGAGCSVAGGTQAHPAVEAVAEILELRRADVRDAEAYSPYFLSSEVATALASGSDHPTGTPCVPEYEQPYLSAETSTTADVAVVWMGSEDFPGWAPVTVFSTQRTGDRWLVIDAVESTVAPAPVAPEHD